MIRHKIRDYTSIKTERVCHHRLWVLSAAIGSTIYWMEYDGRVSRLRPSSSNQNNKNTRFRQRHIYKGDIYWLKRLHEFLFDSQSQTECERFMSSLCNSNLSLALSDEQQFVSCACFSNIFRLWILGLFAIRSISVWRFIFINLW